jgi:hypothetical protein
MFEHVLCQVTDHDPEALESLIELAVEIAREVREGETHWHALYAWG